MLKKSKLFKDYFEWIENQKVTPTGSNIWVFKQDRN